MSYTSPIRTLKNHNSNPYEDQFYKIKALRLQKQIIELKRQNTMFANKLKDKSIAQQIMRQQYSYRQSQMSKLLDQSKNNSYEGRRTSRSNHTDFFLNKQLDHEKQAKIDKPEIEKLLKQIRMLKNQNEIQSSKLKQEIKQLKRKNQKQPQKQDIQFYKREIKALKQKNNHLHQQNVIITSKNYFQQKQLQQLRQSLNTRKQTSILDKQIDASSIQYKQIQNNITSQQLTYIKNQKQNDKINQLKQEIQSLKKKYENQLEILENQKNKVQRQKKFVEQKFKNVKEQLKDKQMQWTGFLQKLSPLLKKKNKDDSGNHTQRASLSLLQVLLKKHKIQIF